MPIFRGCVYFHDTGPAGPVPAPMVQRSMGVTVIGALANICMDQVTAHAFSPHEY